MRKMGAIWGSDVVRKKWRSLEVGSGAELRRGLMVGRGVGRGVGGWSQ
jgi:hypothetical protein